jgi:YhcH/YjgK/YiaL family protein
MKKIVYQGFLLVFLTAVLFMNLQSQTQPDYMQTKKKVSQWFKSREWLNGLQLDPHKSINKEEFAKQYNANKAKWDKAFAYLKETDLANLKPGKYLIDGEEVFATVAEAKSKEFDVSEWESHRKYIDIQLVITGKEKIGVTPLSQMSIKKPYDDARDVAFYTGEGKYFVAEPGTFFIFFPEDAHRPNIKVDGFDTDKKVVVKVSTGK